MTAINEFESVLAVVFLVLGACLATNSFFFAPTTEVVAWGTVCPKTGVAQVHEPIRQDDCRHLAGSSAGRQ